MNTGFITRMFTTTFMYQKYVTVVCEYRASVLLFQSLACIYVVQFGVKLEMKHVWVLIYFSHLFLLKPLTFYLNMCEHWLHFRNLC